eukprot:6187310-Pyramimonas_sp.AAC.1
MATGHPRRYSRRPTPPRGRCSLRPPAVRSPGSSSAPARGRGRCSAAAEHPPARGTATRAPPSTAGWPLWCLKGSTDPRPNGPRPGSTPPPAPDTNQ